jgi:hypothetical protein
MSNSFWNIDEIQQIFDQTTELCITKSDIQEIGDRLESEGYKLFKLARPRAIVSDYSPIPPRARFFMEMGEQLHPLLETAIAILRESLEKDKADERKVQLALEVLGLAFTNGIVDL